jgi:hypothetical protein
MRQPKSNPAAHAGADRANFQMPAIRSNVDLDIAAPREQQARYILKFYAFSLPVALLIAEQAFGTRRHP